MKIASPNNIFTRLLFSCFDENKETNIIYNNSSLLTADLNSGKVDAALLPSLELLNNRDLFVSGNFALSFFRTLGNSYYYFKPGLNEITEIKLTGDISSLEVILTKILFREKYASDVNIELLPTVNNNELLNLMIAGDMNFQDDKYSTGLSFTEEITDMLGLPFVNYIFCAKEESTITKLNSLLESIKKDNSDAMEKVLKSYNFNETSMQYIEDELGGISFHFTSEIHTALHELLRLPYYHGMHDDMFDLKIISG